MGAITFDNEHEERRSGRKWAKTSDSALSHLYGGVKGLGVGVLGGMTAIVSNTITESKRNGIFKVRREGRGNEGDGDEWMY